MLQARDAEVARLRGALKAAAEAGEQDAAETARLKQQVGGWRGVAADWEGWGAEGGGRRGGRRAPEAARRRLTAGARAGGLVGEVWGQW